MAIPASELVKITPRVLSGSGTDLVFNGLLLTSSEIAPVGQLLTFRDASSVAEYFGYDSAEYDMATVYFNGYDNSTLKPSTLFFYRYAPTATAAYLRGASVSNANELLTGLISILNGDFRISIDGTARQASALDFSDATSLSEVAEILQAALRRLGSDDAWRNLKVSFSALTNAFTIETGTKGSQGSVLNASGSVADAMQLSASYQPVSSAGSDGDDYTKTMDDVTVLTQNFVTYSTVDDVDSVYDALALCEWSNSAYNAGNQFLYVYWSQDNAIAAGKVEDTASTAAGVTVENAVAGVSRVGDIFGGAAVVKAIKEKNFNGACGVWGDRRYAAFVMGVAASINWDSTAGTLTFAYKSQSGLEANVQDKDKAANLTANQMNFVGNYASRNDEFVSFQTGVMFGMWSWIDTYLNSTWLNNALQVQILSGMHTVLRAPYTSVGYAMVRSWVQDVIDRALNNGVIEAGVKLSNTQKSEITREAGADITDDIYNNGYYLQIQDATAQIRQQRESPACNFWYTYGGAIHRLSIPSTAVV